MRSEKVGLTNETEPYLATLYGKALDADAEKPILGDRFAAEAVARIDFDFRTLKLPNGAAITLPLRARHFDDWTRAFLAQYPVSTVLHLGCGLDTRVERINPGPDVRWFDVDLPPVIALREQLYQERPGYHRIATSVTDAGWLDSIAGDRPVFVVGEGLVMYLEERDGTALFRRIVEKFPSGQIAFDGYSGTMTRAVSRFLKISGKKVHLVWGMDDPRDLEKAVPGLHLLECVEFLGMPELIDRLSRGSALKQTVHRTMNRLSFYRHLVRHVRYAFGPD